MDIDSLSDKSNNQMDIDILSEKSNNQMDIDSLSDKSNNQMDIDSLSEKSNNQMNNDILKPKILIVDDIPENLFVLERILVKVDAQIIKASSGNEALTQMLDHDFALIILDVQMPEMDGYEVAEIIKSNEKTENIPIIFLTAIDRDDLKEMQGYETGAVDFMFKPLNKPILISKVNVFLEMYRIKNSLEHLVEERTSELLLTNQKLKELIVKNVKATREVESAHSYLLKVIDSISSCLISVDHLGKITNMNSQAQIISGVTSHAAAGRSVLEIFPFYTLLPQMIQQAIDSAQPVQKHSVPINIKNGYFQNNPINKKLSGESTREELSGESTREELSGDSTREELSGDSTREKLSGKSTREKLSGESTRKKFSGDTIKRKQIKEDPVINDFAIYPFRFNYIRGAVIRVDDVTERVKQEEVIAQNKKKLAIDTIHRLTWASEYKDKDTGIHIQRISNYSTAIARKLGINKNSVESLSYAAPMHDIGKIGIPDHILLKQGKLDAEEWEIMRSHTEIGAKILKGSKSGFIRLGELIALTHHEKWDGSGYPMGLKGKQIPLLSRIVAVADVFDSLTTKRPYKEAFSLEKAYQIIKEGRGTHFDPDVVDAFFEISDEILKIKNQQSDEQEKMSFIYKYILSDDGTKPSLLAEDIGKLPLL
ncbi:MAG: response regulator [Desulfamplus sp.]|nr:response regulator [Desulfamplus sp.]